MQQQQQQAQQQQAQQQQAALSEALPVDARPVSGALSQPPVHIAGAQYGLAQASTLFRELV